MSRLIKKKENPNGFVFEDWINSSFYEAAYSELGKW